MNPLELALEQFFNNFRYTPGAFDCLEEGDIFVAEEVVEMFMSSKKLNSLESASFLAFLAHIPRIQGIMTFKMGHQKIVGFLEDQYTKFKSSETSRKYRQVENVGKTSSKNRSVFA